MQFLNNDKIYFVLHDCIVDTIEAASCGLILSFKNGIYIANENADYRLSKSCRLELKIYKFKGYEDNHTLITKYYKARKTEINFKEFCNMLSKAKFKVYLDYYSDYAKSIFIKGSIGKTEVDFIITEIEDLNIQF